MDVVREDQPALSRSVTGTQAIDRTLAILELFRDREDELRISDVSGALGLSGGTVHRIVRALVTAGYLGQERSTGRYYLGPSAALLGQAATTRLGLDRAQAVLDRVCHDTAESVNLGVREADHMVVVIRAASPLPLRFAQEPGSRMYAHATAMGKVSLAHSSLSFDAEVGSLPRPLPALTPNTIVDRAALVRELMLVRKRGYSFDDEEGIAGVRCVAAPVLSPAGELMAAVAIQGPAVRMPRSRLRVLVSEIVAAAQEIGRLLPSPLALRQVDRQRR